jgi:hypothetical protein
VRGNLIASKVIVNLVTLFCCTLSQAEDPALRVVRFFSNLKIQVLGRGGDRPMIANRFDVLSLALSIFGAGIVITGALQMVLS